MGGQKSDLLSNLFLAEPIDEDAVAIVWIGRNNYSDTAEVVADVAKTVAYLGKRHFLVLGIIGGRYPAEQPGRPQRAQIDALNARLAAAYPENYVQVGDDLSCDDRADNIHLSQAGQVKIAATVFAALTRRGW